MTQAAAVATKPRPGTFSALTVAVVIVVGVLAFATFIVLSAFATDLRSPDNPGEHAQSRSAVGFAGMVKLLNGAGRSVRLNKGAFKEAGPDTLLVLSPSLGQNLFLGGASSEPRLLDGKALNDVQGDVLIVLPKWRFGPSDKNFAWVGRGDVASDSLVKGVLRDLYLDLQVRRDTASGRTELTEDVGADGRFELPAPTIKDLQYIESDEIEPVLVDAQKRTIVGRIYYNDNPGRIFVLSDPDFLNTQGLADRDTAEAGYKLLTGLAPSRASTIVFDMTLHGVERSRNLLKLMLEPPFLPATLCLVFAGLLIGLHAASRRRIPKGPKPGLEAGARILVENSALLVAQAGKEPRMGARYADVTQALATSAIGGARGSDKADQAETLDTISRTRKSTSFSALADAARKAANPTTLMAAVRGLYRWRQELGRDRR